MLACACCQSVLVCSAAQQQHIACTALCAQQPCLCVSTKPPLLVRVRPSHPRAARAHPSHRCAMRADHGVRRGAACVACMRRLAGGGHRVRALSCCGGQVPALHARVGPCSTTHPLAGSPVVRQGTASLRTPAAAFMPCMHKHADVPLAPYTAGGCTAHIVAVKYT